MSHLTPTSNFLLRSLRVISFVFLLFVLQSCAMQKSVSEDKSTLYLNLGYEPPTLDWNLADDMNSFDVISNMMHGLTRYELSEDGQIIIVPAVAKSWEVNSTQDSFSFELDPEAIWSDGEPVLAEHFVDSFNRILDPDTAAPYADLLSLIDLERTRAVSKHKLLIKLHRPAAYFPYLTAYGLLLPIRKDLIKKYGDDWTEPENLVINGPFKLKSWQHEYKIELERNPNYWRDSESDGSIHKIKFFMVPEQAQAFTLFKNRQFDFIDGRSIPNSELKNIKENLADDEDLLQLPLLRSTYIGLNQKGGPLANKFLRKALFYAIDRKALVQALGRGHRANASLIAPGLTQYFNPDLADPDAAFQPELARAALKQAGYQNPDQLRPLLFLFPSTEEAKMISELLQSMWQEVLGIKIELRSMEWKPYLATLRDQPPDIWRLNWTVDYPDPDSFMQIFSSTNSINYGSWSNHEYDQIIEKAAAMGDIGRRQQLYRRAETILFREEFAAIPLFVNSQTLIKCQNIKKLSLNPMDMIFLDKVKKQ